MRPRTRFLARTGLILLLTAAGTAVSASPADAPRPFAVVGGDTLTTTDVKIELGLMKHRRTSDGPTLSPEPQQVLRRIIQNRLVVQEGYRMGLQDEFVVANQVQEFVQSRAMGALLDSVAASVPTDVPDYEEARRAAVAAYMAGLRDRYHVSVDSTLLASLDYASDDPEVQRYLREDRTPLAVVPRGTLTVAGFSRVLRFKQYHGLVGKPDAAQRRDKVFEQWLAEAVLAHQLELQGTLDRPPYTVMAERLERDLVLEEALRVLLQFDFAPTEDEVQAFYRENIADFTPGRRVKMASLKVANAEQAETLRGKLLGGTPPEWLRRNDETVVDGPPPFPTDFIEPGKLGLGEADLEVGRVPEPYQVPSGWVVAVVTAVEDPEPTPLAKCRTEVLAGLKARQTQDLMIDIIGRLEDATPIEILPDAEAIVADVIDEFIAGLEAEQAAAPSPSQEG
jgi:hypothetical protein